MNANDKQHDKIDSAGGVTKTRPKGAQIIVAQLYPIVLAVLAAIDVYLIYYLFHRIRWRPFLKTVAIGAVVGWAWNIIMMRFDPGAAAWIFHPWGYSGVFWLQSLEDWIFYPVCGIFFILICEMIKADPGELWYYRDARCFINLGNIIILVLPAFYFEPAGLSEIFFFGLPGTVMLWLIRFNPVHYIKCCLILVLFACIWDIVAVTWLHSIWPWAEQWFYVSFDALGRPLHSAVFIPWGDPFGWVGRSPVEITPFFSIYGSIFIYGLYYKLRGLNVNR